MVQTASFRPGEVRWRGSLGNQGWTACMRRDVAQGIMGYWAPGYDGIGVVKWPEGLLGAVCGGALQVGAYCRRGWRRTVMGGNYVVFLSACLGCGYACT